MTFSARESSLFGGEPIDLIRFRRGNLVWRYTTSNRPITLGSGETLETFEAPGGINRSEIQDSSQRAKNRLTITLPPDLDVAANWLPYPTPKPVLVEVLSRHAGDEDFAVAWSGRVLSPKFFDTKLELVCEPTRSITKSRGNNLRWQRGCPLPLYSKGLGMCNVDEADHSIAAVLTSVDGMTLIAPEFATAPVGRLAGGFLRWIRPDGDMDYRTIFSHVGNTIVVDFGSDTLDEGSDVEALPGCNHSWGDCEYFENTDNYGGVLTIPRKSPHDGDPVQ